jgi:hypothetical protein
VRLPSRVVTTTFSTRPLLKVRVCVTTPFSSVRAISLVSEVLVVVVVVLLVVFALLVFAAFTFAFAFVEFALSLPPQAVSAARASAHEPMNKLFFTSSILRAFIE